MILPAAAVDHGKSSKVGEGMRNAPRTEGVSSQCEDIEAVDQG